MAHSNARSMHDHAFISSIYRHEARDFELAKCADVVMRLNRKFTMSALGDPKGNVRKWDDPRRSQYSAF
jgi:hypothetical protein